MNRLCFAVSSSDNREMYVETESRWLTILLGVDVVELETT